MSKDISNIAGPNSPSLFHPCSFLCVLHLLKWFHHPFHCSGQKFWLHIDFSISIIPQIQSITKYCPFCYPIKISPFLLSSTQTMSPSAVFWIIVSSPQPPFSPNPFSILWPEWSSRNPKLIKYSICLKPSDGFPMSRNLTWLIRSSWSSFCLFSKPSSLTLKVPALLSLFHYAIFPFASYFSIGWIICLKYCLILPAKHTHTLTHIHILTVFS